jgi:hypothetical protein
VNKPHLLIFAFLALSSSQITSCYGGAKANLVRKEANFSFEYKETICGPDPNYIINSKKGKLFYKPLGEKETIIRDLVFTDSEMGSVYQKAIDIDYFHYPRDYKAGEAHCNISPVSSYELTISNGDMINTVVWSDKWTVCYNNEKSNNLRELARLFDDILQKYIPLLALPTPHAFCA